MLRALAKAREATWRLTRKRDVPTTAPSHMLAHAVRAIYRAVVGRPPDDTQLAQALAEIGGDATALEEFTTQLAARRRPALSDHTQDGELLILLRELVARGARHRIIVDVGANGRHGSNSYDLLTAFEWQGLLIEANPQLLDRIRTEFGDADYALVGCAVGLTSGRQTLHFGIDDQLSSLNPDIARSWGDAVGGVEVEVRRLDEILDEHGIPHDVDILSLDIEGLDVSVLNDLIATTQYRPRWIVIEAALPWGSRSLVDTDLSPQVVELYELVERTLPNLILRRR